MNKYSIEPLAKFLNRHPRPEVTQGEFAQLINKISNTRAAKTKNVQHQLTAFREDTVLKILSTLEKEFFTHKKLAISEIESLVDQELRAQGLIYQSHQHPPSHKRIFYPESELEAVYDVGFYTPKGPSGDDSHHYKDDQIPVYYARFEEIDDQLLIGNLQIDGGRSNYWKDKSVRELLTSRKNLYRAMVQESLKEAFTRGKKKIIFQSGAATQTAQFFNDTYQIKKIKITEKNLGRYQEIYDQKCACFDKARVGDHTIFTHVDKGPGIIVQRTPETHVCYFPECHGQENELFAAVEMFFHYSEAPEIANRIEELAPLERKFWHALPRRDYPTVIQAADAILSLVDPEHQANKFAQKLLWCKKFNEIPAGGNFNQLARKFLIHFKYHEVLARKFPELRLIELDQPAAAPSERILGFCTEDNWSLMLQNFTRAQLIKPEAGKDYFVTTGPSHQLLLNYQHVLKNIFDFYEKIVPEVLTKLNIPFKKVPLKTVRGGKIVKSYGWQIMLTPEKFHARPLLSI